MIFIIPFMLQSLLIFFDEFYFHIKRGLPKWERLGHPLDSLSVFVCFLWVICNTYSLCNLKIFIGLSVLSCLFVTKDEWVHKDNCPKLEMWLHAVLFLHHPILLTSLGILWAGLHDHSPLSMNLSKPFIHNFIKIQAIFVFLFMSYQIIYWNFLCPKNQEV